MLLGFATRASDFVTLDELLHLWAMHGHPNQIAVSPEHVSGWLFDWMPWESVRVGRESQFYA